MARVDITYPGDTITRSITALVRQPVSPSSAVPLDVGLVEISMPTEQIPGPAGPPGPGVIVSDTPPADPYDGALWWESDTGILWAWYEDPDSAQWVQISGGTGSKSSVIIADTAPTGAENGQLWWNSANGNLYCWYDDGDSAQWVQVNTNSGPMTPQMFGAVADGITDDTAALQAAAASGADIYVPAGRYLVKDMVVLQNGQTWQGAGRTRSIIYVPNTFNLSAPGVIRLGTTEAVTCSLYDVGFDFQQNTNAATRAQIIQFPWAIIANVPRCQIDRVRISGAWNGVLMASYLVGGSPVGGNAGGAWIGRIEIGAINIGLKIDGALDMVHFDSLQFSLFGFFGTPSYTNVYKDGNTIAAQFGQVDGLAISKLGAFNARVEMITCAVTSLPIIIDVLQLDGDQAQFIQQTGTNTTMIGEFFSNKGVTAVPDIEVLGGRVIIDTLNRRGLGTSVAGTPIVRSSAFLRIDGGYLNDNAPDMNFLLQTTGTCEIRNCTLSFPGVARTVPFFKATGGQMRIKGCTVETQAGSGPLVELALDNHHDISGNFFDGFSMTVPAPSSPSSQIGCYGPNRIAKMAWTPTVTFATPGDFAPNYDAQQGFLWYDSYGFYFELRIQFDTNAFTTAAGQFEIRGLPVSTSGIASSALSTGFVSKVDFTAGYTQCNAILSSNGAILLSQQGDNVAPVSASIANIKPSIADILLTVSGFVRTK